LAQFLHLAFACQRAGLALRLAWPRPSPVLKRFFGMLGQATLGAGITQINLFADTLIASLLPTGAVSYLYYADRLNQLPLGVIGIAVGTVLLPALARSLRAGDFDRAQGQQNRAIELSLVLTLPAAMALGVAAEPITAIFQVGAFDAHATAGSAAALSVYALGLPAFVLLRSLLPSFYARHDALTPVKVALAAMLVNVTLKIVLMQPLAHVGIALSTSVASWINVVLLLAIIRRRGYLAFDGRLRRALPRILGATLALGAGLIIGMQVLHPWLASPASLHRLVALAALVFGGLGLYGLACLVFGVVGLKDLVGRLRAS
jgi:putative peptidoglycan lipid II flippase